jgi:hypothetical protein
VITLEKFLAAKTTLTEKSCKKCVKRMSASPKNRKEQNEKKKITKQNKILPCGAASFGCSGLFKMFLKTVFSLHITDCLHKTCQALQK